MRILNREAFMRCPEGTVFLDYKPHHFGSLSVKTCAPKPLKSDGHLDDFYRLDVDTILNVAEHGKGESCSDSTEAFALMERAAGGERVDLHFDSGGRDGMFDENALFAVLDPEDVQRLIAVLGNAPKATTP